MRKKIIVCAVAVLLSVVSAVFTAILAQSNSGGAWCVDKDCDVGGCEWVDRQWPLENACLSVIGSTSRQCDPVDVPDAGEWRCSSTNSTALCGKVYINYVGMWGGANKCTTEGGGCLSFEYVGEMGALIELCSDVQL